MIHHYHGTPVWGDKGSVHKIAVSGAGAFVSHFRPDQLQASLEFAESVGLDNGAFSFWKNGQTPDWGKFYEDLRGVYDHERLTFFVIPDVIEGGEKENDDLIAELPPEFKEKAAPTWHLHESIDRLISLCHSWPRVCFGSSGEYAVIRTKAWHARMHEAFKAIYESGARPLIHGLRMLDGRVLGQYPLNTADSTNLACNVPKYKIKYPELTKQIVEADYCKGLTDEQIKTVILRNRCAVLKGAIEKVTPPTLDSWYKKYYGEQNTMDEKTQKDSWRTPPELFEPLNAKFRFRFDMAASDDNALCRRYFTAEDSALGRPWRSAWKWCNPPYSDPLPWVEHAAQYRRTVMLLNQDTSTEWARLARRTANLIILLDWRVRFVHAITGERGDSNNKCQQILIFDEAPPAREAEVRIFSLSDLQDFCK